MMPYTSEEQRAANQRWKEKKMKDPVAWAKVKKSRAKSNHKYYEKKKAEHAQYMLEWRENNPEKVKEYKATEKDRNKAKKIKERKRKDDLKRIDAEVSKLLGRV